MRFTVAYDPVTRIEGHLKIEIDIDTVNGVQQVVDARASGGLFRGFERLLVGRDPRDAQHITERICGVCPVAHGMASVRAQDNANSTVIPTNARILRNMVNAGNFVESHILHFYLLAAPDFVEGRAMPPWQADWKSDRRFTKTENDALMAHYLAAIQMRRKADQATALFGGRVPHPPAYIPGGFTGTPRQHRIDSCNALLDELIAFIQDAYLPDVALLASKYLDYFTIGRGYGNLLSYGVFDQTADGSTRLLAPGHTLNAAKSTLPFDQADITEHVAFSWFKNSEPVNPGAGATEPKHPKDNAYSWLKSPRYQNVPYEVGPLARMWINGDYRNGVSVMDRHMARAQEALKVADAMKTWLTQLDPLASTYTAPVTHSSVTGIGLTEAPRGALGHWLGVGSDGRIAHYQVISPTTWNCSPRDNSGNPGPLEQALLATPVADIDEPVEVMRIIHSFDPCLDCATHIARPGEKARIFTLAGAPK